MVKGDKCWIIQNGMSVVSAIIVSVSGNLFLIKTEEGKALRLPKHRLFDTEEKALEVLEKHRHEQKKKTPYDYMM